MRRKGIVVGACAALVLGGSAAVVAWRQADTVRQVRTGGTWVDAPQVARTPVALSGRRLTPGATPTPSVAPTPVETTVHRAERVRTKPRTRVEESARQRAENGRQTIGELLDVRKLVGYVHAPRRETFRYPGASYVKLHFNRMAMLPGDYLTVSNPAGTEVHRYEAPKLLEGAQVDQWAMSITGDTAILELHRGTDPLGVGSVLGSLGIGVDRVARGFSRTEQDRVPEETRTAPGRTGREESVCGGDTTKDAVCYRAADPAAYTRSKAVARVLIDGTELCTAWRVGPNNRMLTNNHCFDNSEAAYDTEVWFNYQCARCGGYETFTPTKVWGDKVLATHREYDYTLFTVENFAAVKKFGFLTLDTTRPAKGSALYVPQHPAGDPTRIAGALGDKAANCAVDDPGYTGYAQNSDVSYFCDTEGGSSGSPVLSRKTHKVVALHHFGGCPNSGVRGDLLAQRLAGKL